MDLSDFSGRLPLFPLPDVVLFPGTFLPLHIFEPRYRAMVADVLCGERCIGMALWRRDQTPDIPSIVGLGRIVHHQPLADGRSNIVLQGVVRARIEEEIDGKSYRQARVKILKGDSPPGFLPVVEELRAECQGFFAVLMDRWLAGASRRALEQMLASARDLGALTDLLCGMVELSTEERQGLLEELDAVKRARRLLNLLRQSPWDPFEAFRSAAVRRRLPGEAAN
jgi:Lon protease-like protein